MLGKEINVDYTLEELGEEKVVDLIGKTIVSRRALSEVLEYPDDARDMITRGPKLIISVDAYGLHSLKLPWRSYSDVAWAAVTGSLSDIVSKGGFPSAILISLGLSPQMRLSELLDLLSGLKEAVETYSVRIIGGDTNSSSDPWISITSLGFTSCKKPPSRRGMRPGDRLLVTGRYGAMGFVALHGIEEASKQKWVVEATRRPRLRVELASLVSQECRFITATMDVSDGLGHVLEYLARLNNLRIIISQPPLVYDEVNELCNGDPRCLIKYSLVGGEEYGLVISVPQEGLRHVLRELELYDEPYSLIGVAEAGEPGIYFKGEKIDVKRWDQFRGWSP